MFHCSIQRDNCLQLTTLVLLGWSTVATCSFAVPPSTTLSVDFGQKTIGLIRPLHGVNGGPIHAGETLDLSDAHRAISVPLTRLHDCHWPSADVVDIHVIFPDFDADPTQPESFDFARTDDYIQSIVDVGSQILFRLGESIEHSKRKYHVHPPKDANQWTAICLGIVRHYNAGWANGFRHDIKYWEIWNEPENRPAMWTGNDEDYYRIYAAAAKTIKSHFPNVRVGGPAVGHVGQLQNDRVEPSPFVRAFLNRCRHDSLPLDFFSWHTYTNDVDELVRRARAVRHLLDEAGFSRAESHLNEWNYLPDYDWSPMLSKTPIVRQGWFERLHGNEGATFLAASLIRFQDSPLDAANLYSADTHGFGMFNEHGVPYKSYYALKAFHQLLETQQRLAIHGIAPDDVVLMAGTNEERTSCRILLSNSSDKVQNIHLRLQSLPDEDETKWDILCLDSRHDLEPTDMGTGPNINVPLLPNSVSVVRATVSKEGR